jgi:hypothetical protein
MAEENYDDLTAQTSGEEHRDSNWDPPEEEAKSYIEQGSILDNAVTEVPDSSIGLVISKYCKGNYK